MVHGQGDMLRAMTAWYQYTGNQAWEDTCNNLVDGIDRIVVHKEDYAFFPVFGWHDEEYLRSCYTKRGWKDTTEPANERFGEEGSLFNHQGHIAGALANWHMVSGNRQALRLSGELAKFLAKPKFWADFTSGPAAEHASFGMDGHSCGHANAIRSILEYALTSNDSRLKLFAREGYEWVRRYGLMRIGIIEGASDWQGCNLGRWTAVAVELSENGIGDYWEDVDQYIRNVGIEMQVQPEQSSRLSEFSRGKPENLDHPKHSFPDEEAPEKAVGGYFAMRGEIPYVWLCCSTHGNMGLFYAWDSTIRFSDDIARVNLLLNRASPWMDIDSYIPYDGKVVLLNKQVKEVHVRMPLYVDLAAVTCTVEGRAVKSVWLGRYLRVDGLKPGDRVEITFPLEVSTETWTYRGTPFTLKMKGNTVIGMDPSLERVAAAAGKYMFSNLERYSAEKTPMKKTTRHVSHQAILW